MRSSLRQFLPGVSLLAFTLQLATAREIHVSAQAAPGGDGSAATPYRTIDAAAQIAQPGDIVTVAAGIYRERVAPPRGGTSDQNRITYQAAPGAKVEIKGSEIVHGWTQTQSDVWKVTLPDSFFGSYNPYRDVISGDWFDNHKWDHHTGEIYLNGKSLYETPKLDGVLHPQPTPGSLDQDGSLSTWYCESANGTTTLSANFHGHDPNRELVEINVRPTCFYPAKTECNYITVRGFHLSQAATTWAAPTAEQIGAIGTNWSKGWIIEDNEINDSKCVGLTLGKDRASGQNAWGGNKKIDGAVVYNEMVDKVIAEGWSKERIGSHLVRNNTIYNCEEAGICGSFGAAFSRIIGNHIYNIHRKRQFAGFEIGGIKIHAAIDCLIAGNCVHDADCGLWLDWMGQGTRVSRNLFYRNNGHDVLLEVDHGPVLFDNNIFLSPRTIWDWSEGSAFVHNLFAGVLGGADKMAGPGRVTPFFAPHSTQLIARKPISHGDDRFYNNLFISGGLAAYDKLQNVRAAGNIYMKGATPLALEKNPVIETTFDPGLKLIENDTAQIHAFFRKDTQAALVKFIENDGTVQIQLALDATVSQPGRPLVTTALLGKTLLSAEAFENPDASPLTIDTDYFGRPRDSANPVAGPFAKIATGSGSYLLWPNPRDAASPP